MSLCYRGLEVQSNTITLSQQKKKKSKSVLSTEEGLLWQHLQL